MNKSIFESDVVELTSFLSLLKLSMMTPTNKLRVKNDPTKMKTRKKRYAINEASNLGC